MFVLKIRNLRQLNFFFTFLKNVSLRIAEISIHFSSLLGAILKPLTQQETKF